MPVERLLGSTRYRIAADGLSGNEHPTPAPLGLLSSRGVLFEGGEEGREFIRNSIPVTCCIRGTIRNYS